MSRIWQQITAAKLLGIYSLAIWLFCCHGYDLHSSKKDQHRPAAEKIHAVTSNSFAGDALQPSTFSNASFSNVHSSSKNSFNELSAVLKLTDQLVASSFIQNSFVSTATQISAYRTDIIFPFHYFW